MDCNRVGKLILALRKQKLMTQKQLADLMNISDKAVSKWERGLGCPDVSLLAELSEILGVNIEKILTGDLEPNDTDGGNMKRIKFYVCSDCGGVLFTTGDADIFCCGRKLETLIPQKADSGHTLSIEEVEFDYFISFSHEMERSHYISFVALVASDRVLIVKLYPEQGGEVRFPKMYGGNIYYYCTQHGLWMNGK